MDILKIDDLTFKYGENEILKNISVSFSSFGLYIILGKSGAGKSTLLNLLQGSLIPTSGKISFINNVKPAISFQSSLLLDYLSVKENISLSLMLNNIDSSKRDSLIDEVLKEVNLIDKKNCQVKSLSGGEKARVSIARTLVNKSPVLILDEPTGALDEETSNDIYKLLLKLKENHLIILVTHDEKSAYEIYDYLYELKDKNLLLIKSKENNQNESNKNIKFINNDSNLPISYKDGIFINYKYLIKHKFRVFISIIFLSFSFAFLYISLNIYFNINNTLNLMVSNYYSAELSTISKKEVINNDNNVKLERLSLPKSHDLIALGINKVYSSLDYFIPEYQEIYLNNIYADCRYIPVIDEDKNKLKIGKGLEEPFFIVVNESFVDSFNLDINNVIGKKIYLYHQFLVEIDECKNKDLCHIEIEFIISGVSKESKSFNEAIIYYSYDYIYNYLDEIKCHNISEELNNNVSLKDILDNVSVKKSDLNSHKYLFLDENNLIVDNNIDNEEYKLSSKVIEVKKSTKELIESIIQIFIIYLFLFTLSSILMLFLSIYTLYDNNIRLFALIKVFSSNKYNSLRICISNGIVFYLVNFISLVVITFISSIVLNKVFLNLNLPNLIKPFDIVSFLLINIVMLIFIIITSVIPMLKIKDNYLKKELEGED